MSGREVVLGRWGFTYFTPQEDIPTEVDGAAVRFSYLDDRVVRTLPVFRRVVFQPLPSLSPLYVLLHYSDGTDLTRLDEKVWSSTADVVDFAAAVATEPTSFTCQACGAVLYAAVVSSDFYPFSQDLDRRLRHHRLIPHCRACNAHVHMNIAEYLDDYSSNESNP